MPALAHSVSLKSLETIFGGRSGTGARALLGAEYEGFALDFTDNTVAVRILVADDLIGSEVQGFALEFVSNTSAVRI